MNNLNIFLKNNNESQTYIFVCVNSNYLVCKQLMYMAPIKCTQKKPLEFGNGISDKIDYVNYINQLIVTVSDILYLFSSFEH